MKRRRGLTVDELSDADRGLLAGLWERARGGRDDEARLLLAARLFELGERNRDAVWADDAVVAGYAVRLEAFDQAESRMLALLAARGSE